MQKIRCSVIFHALALAFCTSIYAQAPPAEQWPDDHPWWSGPEEDRSYRNADNRTSPFDQPYTSMEPSARSSTVTLHELAHHVPRRAEKEYERAGLANKKGDNQAAIEYFNKAIEADPEFCAALNDLGVTYLRLDRIDLAIEWFSRAIAVDPHATKPYLNLAAAHFAQGNYGDAERTARRANDLDRGGTHALLILGASLVMEKKFTEEAERTLGRAAADFRVAAFWLAIGLVGRGDIVNAKDRLKTYLSSAPEEKVVAEYATALLHKLEFDGQSQ